MRLTEPLIRSIDAGGRRYRVNLDFRRVLAMIEAAADKNLLPGARIYRAMKCVTRRPPRDDAKCAALYVALCKELFPAARQKSDGPKLTDFEQDADLIRAAFLQVYGVNLWRDKLHWTEFSALLAALPQGNRYAEILGIRARPVPAPTKYNQQEREWLISAKAACALDMTEEEKQSSYQAGLRAMSESMQAYARKRGGNNA